jgi:molecular chaperone GrpE
MPNSDDKGAFQADIPADAVQEALRSVERLERSPPQADPGAAAADPVTVEVAPEGDAAGAREAELASLRAQVELSTARGRETLEKLKEEHDRFLRVAADLENYRKRAAREREEVQKFGNERLLKDLLPVVDGLDRALAAAPPGDPLADGVRLVRASLEQALARHGVASFSAMGERFDPARHEALLQVPTAESAPGTVVLEHARGFTLNDRLVRPAMVGVAVEPAQDGPKPATG